METINSAWGILWLIMCWSFFILAAVGAAIVLFAVLVGLVRGFKSIGKPRGSSKKIL